MNPSETKRPRRPPIESARHSLLIPHALSRHPDVHAWWVMEHAQTPKAWTAAQFVAMWPDDASPSDLRLVIVFDGQRERTYPPDWAYAPPMTAKELCRRLQEPGALCVPVTADPTTSPETFFVYPSLEDLRREEARLQQELRRIQATRTAMTRVGAAGECWVAWEPPRNMTSARHVPTSLTRICQLSTVPTALSTPPRPDNLLPDGFRVLTHTSTLEMNRILTTQLPRGPHVPWDMVSDDGEMVEAWRRFCTLPGAPAARIFTWSGPVASWPATLSAPVIVVHASKKESRVGYLGALQEAQYVLWMDASHGEGLFCTQQARAYMAEAKRAVAPQPLFSASVGEEEEAAEEGARGEVLRAESTLDADPFARLYNEVI